MPSHEFSFGHFTLHQPSTGLHAIINASVILFERIQSTAQPVMPCLKVVQQAWVGQTNPFQIHIKFNSHDLVIEKDAISDTWMRRLQESLVGAEVRHPYIPYCWTFRLVRLS